MPVYNEALYKYLNYCLDSLANEFGKCEFVMRLNKFIESMPDEADKNAIIKCTQDYFIPRNDDNIDEQLLGLRKGTMIALLNGYASAYQRMDNKSLQYLQEFTDLNNCKLIVWDSLFGQHQNNSLPAPLSKAEYVTKDSVKPHSSKILDQNGNTLVDFTKIPKSATLRLLEEQGKDLPKGLKKRDASLLNTFMANPPQEPAFNQKELLTVEQKLQNFQKAINPDKEFKYEDQYENEKMNVLKSLSEILLYTNQVKNNLIEIDSIENPGRESRARQKKDIADKREEYRKMAEDYERGRKEYGLMKRAISQMEEKYNPENGRPMPKNLRSKIRTPLQLKKKLLQAQIKRLTAKNKKLEKATFKYQKKLDADNKVAKRSYKFALGDLYDLLHDCFDASNGFNRKDVKLTDIRESANSAYHKLNDYIQNTSMWDARNWFGKRHQRYAAAKRARHTLACLLVNFDKLKDKKVLCRYYTLMADGTIKSNRDMTDNIDIEQTDDIKKSIVKDSKDVTDVSKRNSAPAKLEMPNVINTNSKTEEPKKPNSINTESKTASNKAADNKRVENKTAEIKTTENKTEIKNEITASKEPVKGVQTKVSPKNDSFFNLDKKARSNARNKNRDIEFLKDYYYKVTLLTSKYPQAAKDINSNDISVLKQLEKKVEDKDIKRYLEHRINKLNTINDVVKKADENMQNRNVEKANITVENGKRTISVDNVIQSEIQHTHNGCWSVALSTLLRHRGVELGQSEIRAYRPDAESFSTASDESNRDVSNQISAFSDMIHDVLPNTAVNEATYTNQPSNRAIRYTEKEKALEAQAVAKKLKNSIIYGMEQANGPVAILIGGHYRTIYKFEEGSNQDTVYMNDPYETEPVRMSLNELAGKAIVTKTDHTGAVVSEDSSFTISWLQDLKNEKGEVQNTPSMKANNVTYDNGEIKGADANTKSEHHTLLVLGDEIDKDVALNTYLPNKLKDIQLQKENKLPEVNELQKANEPQKKEVPNKSAVKEKNVAQSAPKMVTETLINGQKISKERLSLNDITAAKNSGKPNRKSLNLESKKETSKTTVTSDKKNKAPEMKQPK